MVGYWLGTSSSAPEAQVAETTTIKQIVMITFFIFLPFQKFMMDVFMTAQARAYARAIGSHSSYKMRKGGYVFY